MHAYKTCNKQLTKGTLPCETVCNKFEIREQRENKVESCNILPRPADSNGLIIVRLKRKAEFKGNVLFESVRPHFVKLLLNYLRNNKPLYSNISVENISQQLINLDSAESENQIVANV